MNATAAANALVKLKAAQDSMGPSTRMAVTGIHDLVTEFDRASEELLIARLTSLSPGIPVVGEETSARQTKGQPGLVWYVDPIDGTTNFVHGHPFWCVAVGLVMRRRKSAPKLQETR